MNPSTSKATAGRDQPAADDQNPVEQAQPAALIPTGLHLLVSGHVPRVIDGDHGVHRRPPLTSATASCLVVRSARVPGAMRQALLERDDLRGDAFCLAYAEAADRWLSSLFDQATGGDAKGMALIAVGGYGRGELCPYSDLDVVLLHRGRGDISETADKIWYPVWDEGITLDHSVRRPNEALDMVSSDLRVALGLLDGRVVAGDPKVAEPVLEGAHDRWVKQKPPWLGILADQVAERHRTYGDVGFLLEPDLKEAHGGLRDVAALRAMMLAVPFWPTTWTPWPSTRPGGC